LYVSAHTGLVISLLAVYWGISLIAAD